MSNEVGAPGHHQVGEFLPSHRRIVRTVRNPMDRSTIVSIYPRDLVDEKHTIFPGKFFIPKGTYEKPSITVLGPSSWYHDRDMEQPIMEISVAATQVSESLINDYCNGLLACDMENMMPGIFYIPGEFDLDHIMSHYRVKLAQVKLKQDNWFKTLVTIGDALWARTNNNPLAIWDEMRMACTSLGYERPWIRDFQAAIMVKCKACGGLRNPEFPICPSCRNIDMSHPEAKNLKFAQQ